MAGGTTHRTARRWNVHYQPVVAVAAASQLAVMAGDAGTDVLPDGVLSAGERLWRATPGAKSTFVENVAARELWMDIHRDEFGTPWLRSRPTPSSTHKRVVEQRSEPI